MRKNFCAAPWAGLSLDPSGHGKVCCLSFDQTTIKQFSEIKSNPVFINLRKAFIDDTQAPGCRQCWDRERNGDDNSRRSIYQYDDFFHNLENSEDFCLEHLDLRWSNTCNLSCVYCSPAYSSKWASLVKITESLRVFPSVTDDDLKNLKVLQLAGGEPFLIKENYDILARLTKINRDISIEVTTNLTSIQNNKIYEILKKFTNVTFVVSFESVGRQFEYIRHGANWAEFELNLKQLSRDFLNIQVNMVYFPLSANGISNAIDVALQHTSPDNIFIVCQNGGTGFDFVSQHALQLINQKNTNYSDTLPEILKSRLLGQVNLSSTRRHNTYLPKYEEFDKLTNQNHRLIFPELYYE